MGFLRLLQRCFSTPIKIVLNEKDLAEKFVKGSGPGGQKINKNRSCVQLLHIPTGLRVETQRFRELDSNRKEARKLLSLKLDDHLNGEFSKNNMKIQKLQKQNANRRRKAKKKYVSSEETSKED